MNITLNLEQEAFVRAKLQSGQYQNADEVIQAALHLLDEQDRAEEHWLVETRTKVDEGIASLKRGEGIDGETFVNQLLAKLKETKEVRQ
jgi:antitoxin ParD1/3/4